MKHVKTFVVLTLTQNIYYICICCCFLFMLFLLSCLSPAAFGWFRASKIFWDFWDFIFSARLVSDASTCNTAGSHCGFCSAK